MGADVGFKRAWDTMARTKTPEEVVFGSWLAAGYSRESDLRDFGAVENLLRIQSGNVILDLGCGALARALIYFGGKGFRIVGIDVSAAAVAKARGSLRGLGIRESVDLVVGDVEFLPFREGSFDRVLAVSVISHLASRRHILRALEELRFCAKDDGLCYLSWWLNLFSPFSLVLVLGNRLGFVGKAERIQLLTFRGSSEIRCICERAGLAATEVVDGSVFWYIFYLFPKIVHAWNEKLMRVFSVSQKPHPRVSFPPFFFDLVVKKMLAFRSQVEQR